MTLKDREIERLGQELFHANQRLKEKDEDFQRQLLEL